MSRTPAEVMQDPPDIVLHLPRPPSANELWQPVRNNATGKPCLVKSPKYKAWLTEAGWKVRLQAPTQTIPGDYALRIEQPPGYDLDNISKATNDLLQTQRVVSNDKRCVRLIIDRGEAAMKGNISVHLWSV